MARISIITISDFREAPKASLWWQYIKPAWLAMLFYSNGKSEYKGTKFNLATCPWEFYRQIWHRLRRDFVCYKKVWKTSLVTNIGIYYEWRWWSLLKLTKIKVRIRNLFILKILAGFFRKKNLDTCFHSLLKSVSNHCIISNTCKKYVDFYPKNMKWYIVVNSMFNCNMRLLFIYNLLF